MYARIRPSLALILLAIGLPTVIVIAAAEGLLKLLPAKPTGGPPA